jgi:hypothetical protein
MSLGVMKYVQVLDEVLFVQFDCCVSYQAG